MDLSEVVVCVGNFDSFEPEVMSVISISVVVESGGSVFVAEIEAEDKEEEDSGKGEGSAEGADEDGEARGDK